MCFCLSFWHCLVWFEINECLIAHAAAVCWQNRQSWLWMVSVQAGTGRVALWGARILKIPSIFSERELTLTFAICYRPSVCRLSVTLVRPTQVVEIFVNISTALGTLAIRWRSTENFTEIVPGEPLRRGS